MNTKKLVLLITVLTVFSFTNVKAQFDPGRANVISIDDLVDPSRINTNYDEIKGSPYLRDNWASGVITTSSNQNYEVNKIKLDLIDKSVVVVDKNNIEKKINSELIKQVTILLDGRTKIFKRIEVDNKFLFAEVVYTGTNSSLFIVHNKYIKPASVRKVNTGYESTNKASDAIAYKETPYFQTGSDFFKAPLQKKKLNDVFGNKVENVKKFAKENKLKFSKINDLDKISRYYDSL